MRAKFKIQTIRPTDLSWMIKVYGYSLVAEYDGYFFIPLNLLAFLHLMVSVPKSMRGNIEEVSSYTVGTHSLKLVK